MYNPFKFRAEKRELSIPTQTIPFIQVGGKIISNNLTVDADSALRHSDIYAVVTRISSDIASADIDVKQPYYNVLNNPNQRQTKFAFFQSIVASMLLTGNAFVIMYRNGSSIPSELELVPSQNVEMTLEDDLSITYNFSFDDGRPPINLKGKDVLHFKLMSTGYEASLYTGRSPLESLVTEIAIQDNSNKLTLNALANAITPTNILKVEKGILDNDKKINMKKAFESSMKTGSTIILDQSADLKQISINNDVANFLKNIDYTSENIAKAFCIPSSYVGLNADEQSSIDQIRSDYINSLNMYYKPIEEELSKKLALNQVIDVKLNVSDALDVDNQLKIKNVCDLAKANAISSEQAQLILSNYHILGMDDIIKETGLQNADKKEEEKEVIE